MAISDENGKRGCLSVILIAAGYFAFVLWAEMSGPPTRDALNAGLTVIFVMPLAVLATGVFAWAVFGMFRPNVALPGKNKIVEPQNDLRDYSNVRYLYVDGSLWKGPLSPDSNMHWAEFSGVCDSGESIWTLRSSSPPSTEWLTPEQIESALIAEITR